MRPTYLCIAPLLRALPRWMHSIDRTFDIQTMLIKLSMHWIFYESMYTSSSSSSSSFILKTILFLHTKLGLDVCPNVDSQISGDTSPDLTRPLSGKIAISQLSTHGYWSKFFQWWDALPHQPVQFREETLESGNLFQRYIHKLTLSSFQTPLTPKVTSGASTITCYTKYSPPAQHAG